MPSRQALLLVASAVLGDGAWMFAALAAIGFLSGQGGAPFAWPVVFGLLVAAIVAARCVAVLSLPPPKPQVILTGLGVIGAYAAVALSGTAATRGFEPLWPWMFVSGGYDLMRGIGIAVGIIGAAVIWRHGMVLGAADLSETRLHRSFRIGVAALGLAILVEYGSGRDLGAGAMLLPFFAGMLSALAIARMRGSGASGASWIRLVGASVVGIVGLGLVLAVAGGFVVQGTATMAVRGWIFVIDGLLRGLRFVLEPVVWLIAAFVDWLLDIIPRVGGRPQFRIHGGRWWEKLNMTAATPEEAIGQLLQYPILLLLLLTICWILLRAYRQGMAHRRRAAVEYREPIEGDPTAGLAQLLGALLPSWLRSGDRTRTRRRHWEDDPRIADAFRLYYDALGLAADRGSVFDPCSTATERVPDLARLLPGVPVERITACFIAACYGHKPIDPMEAAALRSEMQRATAAPGSTP